MDDDVDIYGDLPSFDASECLKCKERFKEFAEKNARFEGETLSWKNKCETFETEKGTILLNTSSLLKTARAEIARKDRIIVELRRELEDLKFKRGVWSRAKANHKEPRSRRKWAGENVNKEESWNQRVKAWPVDDRSLVETIADEDEADTEQKWEPNGQISTLYGERLKKKIQCEQESERKRREEAKTNCDIEEAARVKTPVVDDQPVEATASIEQEDREKNRERQGKKCASQQENGRTRRGDRQDSSAEMDKPSESIGCDVKLEYPVDDYLGDWSNEAGACKNMKSTDASVHSSEGEHKSHRYDRRYSETSNSRDERYKDDYYHYQNSNHDRRHNSFLDTASDHRSRNPRDAFIHSEQDRKSRKHQETQHNRKIRENRSKSNYRGRSKTPDRRNSENNRNDRYRRGEKYKDHNDRHEKRRDDGLSRDRYDCKEFDNKNSYDLRGRLERKYDEKSIDRSERNYDSDGKRRGKSRSPSVKPRSKSGGIGSQSDKRETKRSRSRGRAGNTENKKQSDKNLPGKNEERKNRQPENLPSNNFESSKKTDSAEAAMEMKAANDDEPREMSAEPAAEAEATETSTNFENQAEPGDTFILMLENDSEMALGLLTRPEVEPVGSRSFREEKIENIEKFIQDYRCDEVHCNALGIDETSGQNEEFANSTSSIVDTLSMDIDDLVVDTNSDEGTVVDSANALGTNTGNSTEDRKLEGHFVDEAADVKTPDRKLEDVGIDENKDDVGVDENSEAVDKESATNEENFVDNNAAGDAVVRGITEEAAIDEKLDESSIGDETEARKAIDRESRDAADDNRSGELVVDEKMEEAEIDEEPRDSTADKKSEAEEIDAKITADEKTDDVEALENMGDINRDVKSRVAAIDCKSGETLINENVAIDEKSEIVGDEVPDISRDISIETKLKEDEKSKDAAINTIDKSYRVYLENIDSVDRPEEISLDYNAKGSTLGDKSTAIDAEFVNSIDKKPENIDGRERINATESKKIAEEKFDDSEIAAAIEGVPLEKSPKDNAVDGKASDVETRQKNGVSPPLPPMLLPALPPLPPSPPPEEKEPEILRKICPIGSGGQETERSPSKQTKNRPRIPCLPIVSLYSRKRRNFVLTDSVSSHTIVKSLKASAAASDVETEKVKPSKSLETDSPKKIQSEDSRGKINSANELKAANAIAASGIFSSKSVDPVASKPDAAASQFSEPEVDSSRLVTSKDRKKSKDESPSAPSSSKRKIVAREPKIAEKISDETPAESKKAEKSRNCDKTKTSRNSSSTKTSQRGKRSVLKTIATKVSDCESAAGNRKRPLSREKENQSKPAKQAKIMVVTRRRPVQLEDSSTVTTLVSSEHEVPLRESEPRNSAKKKGCTANT